MLLRLYHTCPPPLRIPERRLFGTPFAASASMLQPLGCVMRPTALSRVGKRSLVQVVICASAYVAPAPAVHVAIAGAIPFVLGLTLGDTVSACGATCRDHGSPRRSACRAGQYRLAARAPPGNVELGGQGGFASLPPSLPPSPPLPSLPPSLLPSLPRYAQGRGARAV